MTLCAEVAAAVGDGRNLPFSHRNLLHVPEPSAPVLQESRGTYRVGCEEHQPLSAAARAACSFQTTVLQVGCELRGPLTSHLQTGTELSWGWRSGSRGDAAKQLLGPCGAMKHSSPPASQLLPTAQQDQFLTKENLFLPQL